MIVPANDMTFAETVETPMEGIEKSGKASPILTRGVGRPRKEKWWYLFHQYDHEIVWKIYYLIPFSNLTLTPKSLWNEIRI